MSLMFHEICDEEKKIGRVTEILIVPGIVTWRYLAG